MTESNNDERVDQRPFAEVFAEAAAGCTAGQLRSLALCGSEIALGELLRRKEREAVERCAVECEAMMAVLVGHAGHDYDAYTALEEMAGIIRKLK